MECGSNVQSWIRICACAVHLYFWLEYMSGQKINKNERYMLKGHLRKEGFDLWRLVMSGVSTVTAEEKVFFIEFYVVNPAVSPEKCILGFKSRAKISPEDLHSALAGTLSAADVEAEKYVQPSFVMVKGGIFKENGKHMNAYFPSDAIKSGGTELLFKVGTNENNACALTTSSTYGSVCVTKDELSERPELLCQAGSMSWNLRYETQISFPDFKNGSINWSVPGAKTDFEGKIIFDGEEYTVTPKKSFGYYEVYWGKSLLEHYYHMNSSKFFCQNTGKPLENSCFVVQGTYDDSVSIMASIEGRKYCFSADKAKKLDLSYEFTEIPEEDDDDVKFHWSVSISNNKYVIDIDGFCSDKAMFLRDYECPEGKRKILRIAGSGIGTGEVKVFKKIKKALEQIEYARVENMVCEYGGYELPEL